MSRKNRMMTLVLACVVGAAPLSGASPSESEAPAEMQAAMFDPPSAEDVMANDLAGRPPMPPEMEPPASTDSSRETGQVWQTPSAGSSSRIDVLEIKDMDIKDVFKMLSLKTGLNIVAGKRVQGRVSVFLKDMDVHDALTVILRSNGLAYQEQRGVLEVMTEDEYQKKFGLRFGVDVVTEVIDVSYGKAEDLVRTIQPLLTREVGHVEFDAAFNRIIVTDIKPKVETIKGLVVSMDRKQQEVFIETKIIQVDLNDAFDMGINWDTILSLDGKGKAQFKTDLSGGVLTPNATIGTLTGKDFTMVLNMIESKSNTRILSSPRVAVVNNQEAKILIGSTQPYVTSAFMTPTSGPTTTTETVNFIDVGVKLNVTPTIHDDGFITMKVRPEISTAAEADAVLTTQGNKIPMVKTSQVETTIRVKDGVTIVIAGLIKDEISDADDQIPFLGRIPLVGKLFHRVGKSKLKSEIVIFLTPHIITGDVNTDPDQYLLLKGNKAY